MQINGKIQTDFWEKKINQLKKLSLNVLTKGC